MYVGVGRLELLVPGSGSLKAKRHVVKGIVGGLRAKFNVAVAEVDYQDLWQRASLGYSCVSESFSHAEQMLSEIERYVELVERDGRIEVLGRDTYVVGPEE